MTDTPAEALKAETCRVEVLRDMDVPKGAWGWIDIISAEFGGPHQRIETPRDAETIVYWQDERPAAIVLNLRDQFNHSIQYRFDLRPSPATDAGEVREKGLTLADVFDMGRGWQSMLTGQTLEDSRAVGRTLGCDLFDPIADAINAAEKELGFNPFQSADLGICQAIKIIHAALLAAPSRSEGGADDDEETYQIGLRDGYEKAVQDIDLKTGGDGEYFASTIPGHGCPDAQTMIQGIVERFCSRTFAEGIEAAATVCDDRRTEERSRGNLTSGHVAEDLAAAIRKLGE